MLMSAMIEVIAKCDRRVLDGFKDIDALKDNIV
jgi:hypothetical protein